MTSSQSSGRRRTPKDVRLGHSVDLAKALSHRHRLKILELLAERESSVAAVAERAGLSFANASHHLRSMRDAGLLASHRDGKCILYRVREPSVLAFAAALKPMDHRQGREIASSIEGHDTTPANARVAVPRRSPVANSAAAPDRLDWLAATGIATSRDLVAGESLFHQGDTASAIYQVEQGRVLLTRCTADNRLITLHTARAGEFFAEAGLFSAVYHCDAVAAMPSRVWAYPKQRLLAAFQSDPALAFRFTATLARQIQSLRARLEGRNIRSARERVLHHLALAAGGNERSVHVDGTLINLAQEIGLTHEALYRTLAALEKEGVIRRRGREIVLCERAPI
ncbi:MAG: metalloregulator ArsR/SmtB family transcription factor [Alphaproteobacteria bacterium]|nr:metalloregulator ArsR/SmtB family transcription factor [Alphaproteobacteria bacterium]